MKPVRKAVIAAAGFGTRFLPATKAMPKEMLPIIDRPVIQVVAEELVGAGIEDIIIVTGYHKRSIEDHFDYPSADLIENLKMGGAKKQHLIDEVYRVGDMANFIYVRQKGPYGNGTPLLNARDLIGDEPFIYTWSDDFFVSTPPRFNQLVEAYNEFNCTVLGTVKVDRDSDFDRYGFAGGPEIRPGILQVDKLVEKPGRANAPSDLATNCGFVMSPEVLTYLDKAIELMGADQELYWNDIVKLMMADGQKIIACEVQNGKYYDNGDKLEYMKTVTEFALKDDRIGPQYRDYLRGVLGE